ncbi:enoyl-CoA hydratase-related protein [Erysipelothrix urinaevulpis]|uniref:enoyl-CoA hydratase-related protein n=1 Tax=Erysipelothrix urinaevulpis TaxID=2683717 RepID=UPI001359643A|nr:enoyl-CoA hydratase-related protein [Erysipelothrix urinaevulpis]
MKLNSIELLIEDKIATLTINRPKALNALNTEVLQELALALNEIEKNDNILALILTGSGEKSFVAGADIAEMKDKNAVEGQIFSKLGNKVFSQLENLKIPTIAAVNGFALGGGCELALATDIRIASENALFGQPEVGLGITPGFGGTQRLSRAIGLSKAKEMIFTGRNVKAEQALDMGLISQIVPKGDVLNAAKDLASKINRNAPYAVQASKRAMNQGINLDLEQGLNLETEVFGLCFSTEDQKEGMSAFIDKRKATFLNK